jgi:8-oxo-dGTP pyrophosphatase MutT (NUDIX family)
MTGKAETDTTVTGLSFDEIACRLARAATVRHDIPGHTRAAVALNLLQSDSGHELLFIERAHRPGDPWSGNIGLPGGKVEPEDPDYRRTAERETREELGFDPGAARYLGRLSDIDGAHLPVQLACFVYGLATPPARLVLSDEVKDAFWVPLADLADPGRHGTHAFFFAGDRFTSPCIRLPQAGKPVLWGMTYRMVMELLGILGVH